MHATVTRHLRNHNLIRGCVVVVYHVTIVTILAYGDRLRSTHCREFHYLKLCRPAYFVRTTQLLPHPGHE